MSLKGRTEIKTDLVEVTKDNILGDLAKTFTVHISNCVQESELNEIFLAQQDILEREKITMPDINNKVVVNHCWSATRTIVGYLFGKPIQLVQKKGDKRDEVTKLNDILDYCDYNVINTELADECSITGHAFKGVFANTNPRTKGIVPFKLVKMDNKTTFVAYKKDYTREPLYAVCFYPKGEDIEMKVYTDTKIFTIISKGNDLNMIGLGQAEVVDVSHNPQLMIPIQEYLNNTWRLGDWEVAITIQNAINLIASDSVNDIDQFINSILVIINAELDEPTKSEVKASKILQILSSKELPADAKYIAQQMNPQGTEYIRQYLEDKFREIVGIPERKTRGGGGGDTGDAVKLRDGWADMEIVARNKEQYFIKAEKNVLQLILDYLDVFGVVKGLNIMDLVIKFSRNKTDNLLANANAGATLHGMGIYDPCDVTEWIGITNDPADAVARGKLYYENQQKEMEKQQANLEKGAVVDTKEEKLNGEEQI